MGTAPPILPGIVRKNDKSIPFLEEILATWEAIQPAPTELYFSKYLSREKFYPNYITIPGMPPSLIIKLEHRPIANIGTSGGIFFKKSARSSSSSG